MDEDLFKTFEARIDVFEKKRRPARGISIIFDWQELNGFDRYLPSIGSVTPFPTNDSR